MNIYVFTGPTISKQEATTWLDAVYLPPVSQGDIVTLLPKKPDIIGIIDGYFDSVPAVWHKEILLAIAEGVTVIGSSSMGALRAAELHSFGMMGAGEIFEWYRDGVIDADDEVAIRHGPAEINYPPLNEPLVNIRKTLLTAFHQNIISQEALDQLITLGRQINYWDRSYGRLVQEARSQKLNIEENELLNLETFVISNPINLKKQDAIKLLCKIDELSKDNLEKTSIFDLNQTVFLSRLIDKDILLDQSDEKRLTAQDLINYARMELNDMRALKRRATLSGMMLDLSQRLNIDATESEVGKERKQLQMGQEHTDWLAKNLLTEDEFEKLCIERALITKTEKIYARQTNNNSLLNQLRIEGKYNEVLEGAKAKADFLTHHDLPDDTQARAVLDAYFAYRNMTMPNDVHAYAAELGFHDYPSFILELEKHVLYHKLLTSN